MAVVTKYHGLNGLHSRSLLSYSSGGWKPDKKAFTGLVPYDSASLLAVVLAGGPGCPWLLEESRDLCFIIT